MHPPRSLTALPKVHVHAHLDGSYPRRAVLDLARRRGLDLDPEADLPVRAGASGGPGGWRDVWEFFDAYGRVPALVADLDDLAGLCRALVAQEAEQGVVFFEPAIEPQLYAPRLGSLREVTRVVLGAFADAGREHDVEVGALVTVNTDQDEPIAADLAAIAAEFAGAGVTAFGTAGFEEPSGLGRFAGCAAAARAAGLPVVAHAGQTGGWECVAEAVDVLGATRISHGVRSVEEPRFVQRLVEAGIVLDVAPVSNVALGVVADLASHPAPVLHRAGVGVTLNADDQLWFGRSVSDQYAVARDVWGLPDTELAALAGHGLRVEGMSSATRQRLGRGLADWLGAP
ncbi:adenosine deaminase family protein [Kineococcus sp. SYSU DK001]|uniref:adenosine deaminase family protein n=1 Tax=Kineococcus sp. SYSU DK001 TaxID=3383122 RepID=UPI003D7EDDE6